LVVIDLKIRWERLLRNGGAGERSSGDEAESGRDRRQGGQAVPHLIGHDDARPPHPSRALSDGARDCLPLLRLQPDPSCLGWDSEDQLAPY
jgi:hypothetical protein